MQNDTGFQRCCSSKDAMRQAEWKSTGNCNIASIPEFKARVYSNEKGIYLFKQVRKLSKLSAFSMKRV